MGYYTNFKLEFDTVLDESVLLKELNEISDYVWGNDFALYDVKWYDYDTHMKLISEKYPDTLFSLYGDGEEDGDIWVHYFKNGKTQYAEAKIVYEKFDETKLED